MTRKLTPKQERFVIEYLIDLNATAAAVRAGYSERTANQQGPELLTNRRVQEAISQAQSVRQKRTEITQDMVLQELGRIAFFDIRRVFNDDGTLKKVTELDDDTARAVASIEALDIGADGQLIVTRKFKAGDKLGALHRLGEHLGMFVKKVEDVTDPFAKAMGNMTAKEAMEMLAALDEVKRIQRKANAG